MPQFCTALSNAAYNVLRSAPVCGLLIGACNSDAWSVFFFFFFFTSSGTYPIADATTQSQEPMYGNFKIFWGPFHTCFSALFHPPHVPCDIPCLVPVLIEYAL